MKNLKSILSITLIGLSILGYGQKSPEQVKDGYKIEIKTSAICIMCKVAIEKDLTFEKGVKSVVLDVESKVATVVYNPKKTNPELLRKRITKVGYNADDLKRDAKAYDNLPMCCKDGAHGDKSHMKHKKDH